MKIPQEIIVLVITLLAFLLRAYRLDFQSYWIDEALTIFYANLSLSKLQYYLQTVRATPPLYHGLTVYWVDLLGDGEYSLRFFSLLFSVLAVPLAYRLGRDLGDGRLGLLTALLLAVAPYQIWHAQDARNYSMLTAASIMSLWGFVNLWQRGGWRWWLVYVIGTEWAIMTHYHGLVIIGVQGLFFLFTWRRYWRHYLAWGGTLLVILLPYAAWLIFGSRLWQGAHWLPQVGLWESYLRSAIAYSVGELVPRPQAIPLTLVFVIFYGLGLIYAARRSWGRWRGSEMLALLLAYTLAPNIAAWVYSQWQTPVYLERYLIPVQVGYLLTIAIGILAVADGLSRLRIAVRIPQWLPAGVIVVGLLAISGWVLKHHYTDPVYAKPDWRGVIRMIEDFSLPGDAIIMTGDGGEKLFEFYYRGDLPVYASFNTPVPSVAEAQQIIAGIAANHRRIWYTPYGVDIDNTLEAWLANNAYPGWHSWLGRKRLALYSTNTLATDRLETLEAHFPSAEGRGPTLLSAALPGQPVAAGDLLPLNLTWLATTPLEHDYKLSVRLINPQGDVFAQSDWPPSIAGGTTTWPLEQPMPDHRSLWLPVDTPPGVYALQLVVYEPLSGQGLGGPVTISDIAVAPAQITPPLAALPLPNPSNKPLGDLTLVGYAAPEVIQPGQDMWLWLYWQAQKTPEPGMVFRLSLDDREETLSQDFPMAEVVGPLASWQPGQVRRAVYHFSTSPRLSDKKGQIKVALLAPPLGGRGDDESVPIGETSLAQVELDIRDRKFEAPSIAHPLNIAFGTPVRLTLLGRDLPQTSVVPNEVLPTTLYWQAEAEMNTNYTVFVQLLNQVGQVVAQVDQPPLAGAAPTTTWLPGEILVDPYTLALPNLPPGAYRLIAGLYNPLTGERLSLASGGDFVELGTITVQ